MQPKGFYYVPYLDSPVMGVFAYYQCNPLSQTPADRLIGLYITMAGEPVTDYLHRDAGEDC